MFVSARMWFDVFFGRLSQIGISGRESPSRPSHQSLVLFCFERIERWSESFGNCEAENQIPNLIRGSLQVECGAGRLGVSYHIIVDTEIVTNIRLLDRLQPAHTQIRANHVQ